MTRRQLPFVITGLALAGLFVLSVRADDKDKKEPTKEKKVELPKCVVGGETVNFLVSTETKDGPVYFCCEKCIAKYKESPDKYAKAVEEQRKACAALPRVQTACPVSGKAVDRKAFIEEGGKKTYFCCAKCPDAYKKDPAKYKSKLEASYTYQTKCPIMDEEIDPAVFITTKDGHKVYFCCDHCNPKFLKDPAKYTAKLAEVGVKIDPAKVK